MIHVGDDVVFSAYGELQYGAVIAIEGAFAKVRVTSICPSVTVNVPMDNVKPLKEKRKAAVNRSQEQNDGTAKDAKHYQKAAMQPIEVMQRFLTREEFIGFLKGNIIKYKARAAFKGSKDEDAQKARQYAYWLALAECGVAIKATEDSVPKDFKMDTTFDITHNYSDADLIRGGKK